MRTILLFLLLLIATTPALAADEQQSYRIEKVADHLYAAIARPGSTATSNAFFYVGRDRVVAGGAHMTAQASRDLIAAIGAITQTPLRLFILPHHHTGYTSVDFYLPPEIDLVMTYPTWHSLDTEVIAFPNQSLLYSDGMTLKIDNITIILTNMGGAHSGGDTLVYIPEKKFLFTSDLVYVDSVGFMGEAGMQQWVIALEFMEQLEFGTVIPGYGPVSKPEAISRFKEFYKSFLSEVIRHIEAGDSLEKTVKTFRLPEYRHYAGYEQVLELNVRRAYANLKETVLAP